MSFHPQVVALEKDMVAWRRTLHANPELSFEEVATQAFVLARLAEMGITTARKIARTGVIARLGPATGAAVALRADMDGLPIQENTGLPFASKNAGRHHACSHDGHMAALLGVASVLARAKLHKAVVLLFQPAEEGLHGARLMVQEGCLDTVTHVFGVHLFSTVPLFDVALGAGPVFANSDRFTVRITGKGGHGSMPHDSLDPVVAAAHLVTQAQQIVSRNVDPTKAAVVSFGGIRSSSYVANILPESVELCGTTRCYEARVREMLDRRLAEVCSGVAKASGTSIDYKFSSGYNAVINGAAAVELARNSIAKVAGAHIVGPFLTLAAEDFSYYSIEGVETCFIVVGSAIADGKVRPHHSPEHDFDERAMLCSASVLLQIALDLCEAPQARL